MCCLMEVVKQHFKNGFAAHFQYFKNPLVKILEFSISPKILQRLKKSGSAMDLRTFQMYWENQKFLKAYLITLVRWKGPKGSI